MIDHVPVVVSDRGAEVRASALRRDHRPRLRRAPDRDLQDTLGRDFGSDPDLLVRQVERTLRHEVAHHLGYNEPGVAALGL